MELNDKTVETLIDLDEPEALLETFRRKAARKTGKRWLALSRVLDEASLQLDMILNAKPAGPDFRPDAPGAKGDSQPQTHEELIHADAPDAPDAAVHASPAAPEAT